MSQKTPTSLPVAVGFGLIACLLYGFNGGTRTNMGILLAPLMEHSHSSYAQVSLVFAVTNLVFGAVQPLMGMLALRTSNRFVMSTGVALIFCSLAALLISTSFPLLMMSLGGLYAIGSGAVAFGLVLASATYFVGPERAMLVAGMLNAAAGLGSFVLAPVMQSLIDANGLTGVAGAMLVPVALLLPIAWVVTSRDPKRVAGVHSTPIRWGEVARHRVFVFLFLGFSTCGFHMVIIESHLFNEFVKDGIPAQQASWAFSLYGIATITGALLSGWLSTRIPMGRLLVYYYGFRAVWTLAFLFIMPHTLPFAVLFAIGIGMTGDATVSPTAGLVNRYLPLSWAPTLIGLLLLIHQVGAFFSASLGGVLLDWSGSYVPVWLIDVVLCVFAAIMSAMIGRGTATVVRASQ